MRRGGIGDGGYGPALKSTIQTATEPGRAVWDCHEAVMNPGYGVAF